MEAKPRFKRVSVFDKTRILRRRWQGDETLADAMLDPPQEVVEYLPPLGIW